MAILWSLPFTLAHPAAVMPLRRLLGRRAVLSALIVGSVVPDLVYFLPFLPGSASHSLVGVLRFGIPVGLLCYCLYYLLVAPLLFALLPGSVRCRMPDWQPGVLPSLDPVALFVNLGIGALTHVVWDSITHASGLAQLFPVMATPLFSIWGYTLFVFNLLQHSSTIFGVGLLIWWTRRWLDATPPSKPALPDRLSATKRGALILLIVSPGIAVGLAAAWPALGTSIGALRIAQLFVGLAVVAGGRVFLITLLAAGLIWRLRNPREVVQLV